MSTVCGKDGEIDEEGQRSLVSFNIGKGVHGLIPMVMNGEFYKFTEDERRRVTDIVVDEANGKVPVFVGTGHSGTKQTIDLSKYAQDAGADGVVIIPPYFNAKETRYALYDHYSAVARAIDIPIMIQEVEETTGVPFSSSLVARLNKDNQNIKYLKTEGTMAIPKMVEVKEVTRGRVKTFGGFFGFSLVEELEAGASGTVPGCSIPELCLASYAEYLKGDVKAAKRDLERYRSILEFDLLNVMSFPQIDLEILKQRKVIKSAFTRGPRVPLTEKALVRLKKLIQGYGLERES